MKNTWALTKEGSDTFGLFLADDDGSHYGQRIAQINSEEHAALIRNAPDMLALLKAVVNSDMAQREEDDGNFSPLLETIREVIERATA